MADDHGLSAWPKEDIPGSDRLYMRVHRVFEVDGELQPGVFRDHPPKGEDRAMSTDWSKYATPEETLRRAKVPSDNGVIGMVVGEVREIPGLKVEHSPLPENRSHTDIFGKKDPEVRLRLLRICRWMIRVPAGN